MKISSAAGMAFKSVLLLLLLLLSLSFLLHCTMYYVLHYIITKFNHKVEFLCSNNDNHTPLATYMSLEIHQFSWLISVCVLGSVNESVSCCALYFLRPLLLLWGAPYITNFSGNDYSEVRGHLIFVWVIYQKWFILNCILVFQYVDVKYILIVIIKYFLFYRQH